MAVRLKRAYEPAERSDGYRVLIDRIWPRGVSREQARPDEWARELAPSTEQRIAGRDRQPDADTVDTNDTEPARR